MPEATREDHRLSSHIRPLTPASKTTGRPLFERRKIQHFLNQQTEHHGESASITSSALRTDRQSLFSIRVPRASTHRQRYLNQDPAILDPLRHSIPLPCHPRAPPLPVPRRRLMIFCELLFFSDVWNFAQRKALLAASGRD